MQEMEPEVDPRKAECEQRDGEKWSRQGSQLSPGWPLGQEAALLP